jgi:hypothetical protein
MKRGAAFGSLLSLLIASIVSTDKGYANCEDVLKDSERVAMLRQTAGPSTTPLAMKLREASLR